MISRPELDRYLTNALAEDMGAGDITSEVTIDPDAQGRAEVLAKQELVVAGLCYASRCFTLLDSLCEVRILATEGKRISHFEPLAEVSGNARAILAAERTFLNLLQHMCGVATLTASFVEAVRGTNARIVDTRKILPGLRAFDKYAVRMGGGSNHRLGLYDSILIKDNHIQIAGGVLEAVRRAKQSASFVSKIEVEVKTYPELELALESGADIIMLDNFAVEDVEKAVRFANGRAILEASGGVDLERVRVLAQAGVDIISVGKLTHSAPAADISLDFVSAEGYI